MATHQALAMPDTRSLQVFQDQVLRGMWPDRHLRALSSNPETVGQLVGLLQCTKDLMEQTQNDPNAKSRRQSSRNILCLCHAVCQEETLLWARCARKAASACPAFAPHPLLSCPQAQGESARSRARLPLFAEAIKAGQEPEENCASYRLKLERCTQRQTSILLQAALVPPDRQDVCL